MEFLVFIFLSWLAIISINNKDSSTQLGSIKELTQFYAKIMQNLETLNN
jgi:hypothetical protein